MDSNWFANRYTVVILIAVVLTLIFCGVMSFIFVDNLRHLNFS